MIVKNVMHGCTNLYFGMGAATSATPAKLASLNALFGVCSNDAVAPRCGATPLSGE